MTPVLTVARYAVFGAVALAALAGTASWLVRDRHVSPFSPFGRFLRSASDPLLDPVEARLLRSGGNPRHAGWWLVVGVAVVGLLLLALLGWLTDQWVVMQMLSVGGAWGIIRYAVNVVYQVLFFALLVRVVGSWLGAFRYNRWMRIPYLLTDWLVEPIRRALPPLGRFDFSPLVALLVLWVLKSILLRVLPF
jgi:YggT family protein